jgi:hypothetical protein
MNPDNMSIVNLLQFDTELQFSTQLKEFAERESRDKERILIVQTEVSTDESLKLIDCAR